MAELPICDHEYQAAAAVPKSGAAEQCRYNLQCLGSAKSYYDVINKTLWAVNFIVSNHPIC